MLVLRLGEAEEVGASGYNGRLGKAKEAENVGTAIENHGPPG